MIMCEKIKYNHYLLFLPLHCPQMVLFICFFQAVDDSGMPGLDRVDSLAECLVELRNEPSLVLTNQQVRNIYCLATFPSVPCHTCSHFSCAFVSSFCSGKQHCCSVAESAGLRQAEGGVCCQTPEQTGHREVQVSQEETGVHSRGGECKEARTYHHCPPCPVARLLPPD